MSQPKKKEGSNFGAEAAVRAPADGYKLLLVPTVGMRLRSRRLTTFDPVRDAWEACRKAKSLYGPAGASNVP
jgi:hypothetical protein